MHGVAAGSLGERVGELALEAGARLVAHHDEPLLVAAVAPGGIAVEQLLAEAVRPDRAGEVEQPEGTAGLLGGDLVERAALGVGPVRTGHPRPRLDGVDVVELVGELRLGTGPRALPSGRHVTPARRGGSPTGPR